MSIKLLSLFASPKEKSFSSQIHHSFLKSFKKASIEIKEYNIYKLMIAPCIACGACDNSSICPEDKAMNEIYDLLRNSSLISISSPLYFSSLPGPLKNLIDRCQLLWRESERGIVFPKKRGIFFSSGGSEYKDMFNSSLVILRHFFNTVNADFNEDDSILISGMDSRHEIDRKVLSIAQLSGEHYLKSLMKEETIKNELNN